MMGWVKCPWNTQVEIRDQEVKAGLCVDHLIHGALGKASRTPKEVEKILTKGLKAWS